MVPEIVRTLYLSLFSPALPLSSAGGGKTSLFSLIMLFIVANGFDHFSLTLTSATEVEP